MKATKVSKKKKKKTRKEWKLKGERKEEELPADIFECIEHGLGIEFYREALENTPNFMVERSPENGWLPIHFFVRKNMNKLSAVEAEKNPVLFNFWALPIFRFFIGQEEFAKGCLMEDTPFFIPTFMLKHNFSDIVLAEVLQIVQEGLPLSFLCDAIDYQKSDNICALIISEKPECLGYEESVHGWNMLHKVIWKPRSSNFLFDEILKRFPDTAKGKAGNLRFPLYMAMSRRFSEDVLIELFEAYPDVANHVDVQLNTPLHCGVKNNVLTKTLLYSFAEINPGCITSQDAYGEDPLTIAKRMGNIDPGVVRAMERLQLGHGEDKKEDTDEVEADRRRDWDIRKSSEDFFLKSGEYVARDRLERGR